MSVPVQRLGMNVGDRMGNCRRVMLVQQRGTCTGIGGMMTELQSHVCAHAHVCTCICAHVRVCLHTTSVEVYDAHDYWPFPMKGDNERVVNHMWDQ